MKLRYFQTYDRCGRESEPELQYWDAELGWGGRWVPVPFVRVRESEEEDAMQDENAV